jgi:hypothetical protein
MNTEILDKLFLELSQITMARTAKEIELEKKLTQWMQYAAYCRSCAKSGDHDPHDFEAFLARSVPKLGEA